MSLPLLADECVPAPVVRLLREAGHDVVHVIETSAGTSDIDVLAVAGETQRVLLTEDRDFGTLVFLARRPAPAGVVFYRLSDAPPFAVADRLTQVLAEYGDSVRGAFTTVTERRVRQRGLPDPERE